MERTTTEQRRLCYERHQNGRTYAAIAEQLGISPECVRYWYRQQRDGRTKLDTRYAQPKTGLLGTFDSLVRYVILRVRVQHPRWGVGRIRHALAGHPALRGRPVPCQAQIGRYLHQWPRFRRPPRYSPRRTRPTPPQHVHQRWQFDFKLGIPLHNGRLVNLYTIREPVGAACISAMVVDAGAVGQAPAQITIAPARQALRRGFARWQLLPDQLQTDHQSGLATTRQHDFPSLFTLWLTGLHIEHLLIRPGCPTDNAEVERCHRTITDYAIIGNEHLALASLQQVLDEAIEALNWELPSYAHGCHGQPPVIAHPALLQPRRAFSPDQELERFDLSAVEAYLAQFCWERTVSKVGQVDLGAHRYSVGRQYARTRCSIRFTPATRQFIVSNGDAEIRRLTPKGLDPFTILGLDQSHETLGPQQLPLPLPD